MTTSPTNHSHALASLPFSKLERPIQTKPATVSQPISRNQPIHYSQPTASQIHFQQSQLVTPPFPYGWLGAYATKSQTVSPEDKLLDKSFEAMGLSDCTKTDPKIMRELLAEAHLDQLKTTYPPLKRTLQAAVTEPQNLSRMMQFIRHGLKNNPAVMEFIKMGVEKGYFQKSKFNIKAVHMAVLLETLTFTAVNSTTALADIEDHFMAQRQLNGFHPGNVFDTFFRLVAVYHNVFEPLKAMSIDPAVTSFRFLCENKGKPFTTAELTALVKKGKINFIEKAGLSGQNPKPGVENAGLQLNILEAGITEFNAGYKDNALVAYALTRGIQKPTRYAWPQGSVLPLSDDALHHSADEIDPKNYHHTADFSKAWVDLYESWNMAFIVSQMDDLHLILPKLFIPSQIDCKPEEYIFNRVMTLNNVINFNLFRKLDHRDAVPAPENRREIAQTWGAINKQHALDYVQKELGIAPADFEKECDTYFRHRLFNFSKLALQFVAG